MLIQQTWSKNISTTSPFCDPVRETILEINAIVQLNFKKNLSKSIEFWLLIYFLNAIFNGVKLETF